MFSCVKYRTELGTCVYFAGFMNPPAVLVFEFSDSPLDYDALRQVITSGNAHILATLHLPIPHGAVPLTIH